MQFQATGKDKVPKGEVDHGSKIAPLPREGYRGVLTRRGERGW